jgi:hypothetical protein
MKIVFHEFKNTFLEKNKLQLSPADMV